MFDHSYIDPKVDFPKGDLKTSEMPKEVRTKCQNPATLHENEEMTENINCNLMLGNTRVMVASAKKRL